MDLSLYLHTLHYWICQRAPVTSTRRRSDHLCLRLGRRAQQFREIRSHDQSSCLRQRPKGMVGTGSMVALVLFAQQFSFAQSNLLLGPRDTHMRHTCNCAELVKQSIDLCIALIVQDLFHRSACPAYVRLVHPGGRLRLRVLSSQFQRRRRTRDSGKREDKGKVASFFRPLSRLRRTLPIIHTFHAPRRQHLARSSISVCP